MATAETGTPGEGTGANDGREPFAHPVVLALAAVVVAASAIGRFVVGSELWLDEALSVNISKLPIGEIGEALRHDGHPPLYYVLLHAWMSVVGETNGAARALSGVISLATLPLAYLVGRRLGGVRLGWTVALVYAVSPFAFRYGSETRMYSLVMALVFAGYLCVDHALERPRWGWLAGVALVTGGLLWTQYWSMWLLAAAGLLLVARIVRDRRRGEDIRPSLAVIGAMVVGGLTLIPWLSALLYQNAHTGTPWSKPFRITNLVVQSFTEFAGGSYAEAQVGAYLVSLILVVGVFGIALDDRRIELDFATRPIARRPLLVLSLTVVIASAVGLVNRMGFSARYAAVFYPIVAVLIAMGLDRFRAGRTRDVIVALFLLTSLAGCAFVFRYERTQAGEAADAIVAATDGGVVAICPDQLGPPVARLLDRDRFDVFTYPRFEAPERVDWVDYKERNARNDPDAFAAALLERAQGKPLFMVIGDRYLTLEGQCQRVAELVAAARPGARTIVFPVADDFYEPMAVLEMGPPTE